ncbi:hypothetical protein [Nonomuraea sp. NPDC050643]|uniref:hypothetical protein n=1 Tax=Nonomuraea sp. NPDC050643 TaxID=3155660 RepID=UPI0033E8D03C
MSTQHGHDHENHETFDVHGMLLFGGEPLYFSHLPMFRHPAHRFQVLMEVDFRPEVREAVRRDMTGDDIHTFVPEAFDILELDPDSPGPARTSIAGTVFRGHFERGGRPLVKNVAAEVKRVAFFRRLEPRARHDDDAPLAYLCFGRAGALHLAHEITARPDFDQILEVRLVPGTVRHEPEPPQPRDVLRQDFLTPVAVTFGRVDTPGRRLVAGDRAEGVFFLGVSRIGERRFTAEVEVVREVYMETGDLT